MIKSVVCVLSLFGCIVSCAKLFAQETDTLKWYQIHEVSVEENFGQKRSHVTTTIPLQRMSQKEFNVLGIRELADALKLMNGVTVKDYGGLGGMKTVSVRNLGAEHTAVVYDGIPVSNCQAGKIDIARFSTENLQEMRLGIGATEEMLMPASIEPFSGSIMLSTRRDDGTEVKGSIGSFATLNAGISHTVKGLNMMVDYNHTDGNYPFTLTNGELKTRETRGNSRVDNVNAELNYTKKAKTAEFDNKIYFYFSDRQLPGGIILYNNENHETLLDKNLFGQSKYIQSFGQKYKLQALIKYNRGENRYFDGNQIDDHGITMHRYTYQQDEGFASIGGDARIENFDVSLVSDMFINYLHTNIPEYDNKHRTTSYTTLRGQYKKGDINIHASLVYTYLDEATARRKLTPSIAFNWTPKIMQNASEELHTALRASFREAYRLPTFNDMYYYRLGNHDLRPESAKESNLGLTMSYKGLSLTADLFYNKVKDLIVAIPTTFAWRMSNYGRADLKGLNLAVEYGIGQVKVNANYNLNDARNMTNPESEYYKSQIPYTARHSGSASAIWTNRWVNVGYSMQWMGKRYSSIMQEQMYLLKSYQDHNLTLSKKIVFNKCELETTLSAKNIFDCQYEIIQFYPMPGRQVIAGCKITIR